MDDFNNLCSSIACNQPAQLTGNIIPSNVGITTQIQNNPNWPNNVNGGNLVLESKEKGFVIPSVSSANTAINHNQGIEGMIIYDQFDKCVKLFNGTEWKCLTASCVQ